MMMTNINPIPWSVVVLAACIVGGLWLYNAGAQSCDARWKAHHAESLARAIEQASTQARQDAEILSAAAALETKIITRTRTITKEVARHVESRPDYRLCQLDACGLCLARAAHGGTDSARCPCQPAASLPGTTGTASQPGRIAQGVRGDGQPVSPVPGTAQRLNSMDGK